jgi:hypothetical protein
MANLQLLPYAQQVAAIERQRKLANLLQEQGMQPSTTQMVSGIAVPTSPWESASKLAQNIASIYAQSKADEREAATKKQAREEANKQIQGFIEGIGPQKVVTQTPVAQDITQAAGPEEYQDIMNEPFKRRDMSQAATPEDVQDIVNQPYVTQDATSYKPGMNRSQALAKLLEMKSSDNPYLADATSVLSGLMPKEATLEMGAIDPSKFTPASIKAAMQSNDPSLLEPETKPASLPSAIEEYNWAVENQGYKGTLAEWQKQKAMNVNIPSPETYGALTPVVDPTSGQVTYVRPGSRGSIQKVEGYTPPPKAPTQEQVVAGTYANKIQDAEDVLGKFGAKSPSTVPSVKEQFKADIPFVGNQLVKQDTQSYKVAERAFIEAWLRKTSGAVISPSEFEQARKQYIPQPGDTNQVIEQKRQARQRVLQGMVKGAGQYYEDISSELPPGFMSVDGAR